MTPDAWGFLFYTALAVGQVAVTQRWRWGWLARVVGSLGWAAVGVAIGMWSIVAWSFVFAAVDWRGWIVHRRNALRLPYF